MRISNLKGHFLEIFELIINKKMRKNSFLTELLLISKYLKSLRKK